MNLKNPRCFSHLASFFCCFLSFAAAAHAGGLTLTDSGQGLFSLSSGPTGAAELSGITYAGGTSYYAVGDNKAKSIWQLSIAINSTNGRITSGSVTGAISAPGMGDDSEGIALRPGGNSVWISDEVASTITEFSLSTGSTLGSVTVPTIYKPSNVQGNMGLESLSYGAGKLWTANEEALVPDGSLSTISAGTWVRLQQFVGANFSASGQWAYLTDSIPGTPAFSSGLVDLLALPTGEVLALERALGGSGFRSRIYEIDFTRSTDVTNFSSLNAGGFTAVDKRLLWQGNFDYPDNLNKGLM
jgi:DNA-binding beta-propeller fold protein YncE